MENASVLNEHAPQTSATPDPTLAGAPLTKREKDIEALAVQGHGQKEISFRLGISPGTVKVYSSRLLQKRNVASMHELSCVLLNGRIAQLEQRLQESGIPLPLAAGVLVQSEKTGENTEDFAL